MMSATPLHSGFVGKAVNVLLNVALVILFQNQCLGAGNHLPKGFLLKTFVDGDGEHRYGVFVPESYSGDKKWPVVLFLHGAGEKGTDGIQQLSVGLGTALEAEPDQNFIAVFPQCENVRGRHLTCWLGDSPDGRRALKVLDSVEQEYNIDPDRRTLCGWSMGGYGAVSLAEATPEKWQGVLVLSGGMTDQTDSLQELADRKVPIWAIHGQLDRLIPAEKSESLIENLNALGGNGVRTEVPGTGHDVWRFAFADDRVLQWLTQPDNQTAKGVSGLGETDPLPDVSHFFVEFFTETHTIHDGIALRLGNDSLNVISQGIQNVLPSDALAGELTDIERSFRAGDGEAHVKLSNVRFEGQIADAELSAVSSGRFRAVFSLKPLRLKFGAGRLQFGDDQAMTGPFFIELGHRHPIELSIEIQPRVDSTGLTLVPLRQKFSISDENWFIRRPEQLEVNSDRFSADEIMTGLVGGLYLRKSEVEEAIKGVVPTLLRLVEKELNSREVPKLARLLWPFPALIPYLSVTPSQVVTDPSGLSIVFDLKVRSEKHLHPDVEIEPVTRPLVIDGLDRTSHLEFRLSLDVIRALGSIAIRDDLAFLNVLDIQDERFDRLADSSFLAEVFPDLDMQPGTTWNVGLEMVEPFTVEGLGQEESGQTEHLRIRVPRANFLVENLNTRQQRKIEFSLTQTLSIEVINVQNVPTNVRIEWLPDAQIEILSMDQSAETNPEVFRNQFLDAWSGWTEENSGGSREIPKLQFGKAALLLETFFIRNGVVSLNFFETYDVEPIQASAQQ